MLPLVDKPIIQYCVEEALDSGIDNVIIVTGRGKAAIEDHFDKSFELEHELEARGKTAELEMVRKISDLVHMSYIRQKEPLGLAMLSASPASSSPRSRLPSCWPTTSSSRTFPVSKQLTNIYGLLRRVVIAVMEVPQESISGLWRRGRGAGGVLRFE